MDILKLKQIQKGGEKMPTQPNQTETEITKDDLLAQKNRLDQKIKRFEKKEIDSKIISSLQKIREVNEELTEIQQSLNLVWKRSQQIEEELRETLTLPHETDTTFNKLF